LKLPKNHKAGSESSHYDSDGGSDHSSLVRGKKSGSNKGSIDSGSVYSNNTYSVSSSTVTTLARLKAASNNYDS
jgi:hypothetical protein